MDKIDQQYLNEIVGGTESGELDTQHDLKVHEENTTIEELEVHCLANRVQIFLYNFVTLLAIYLELFTDNVIIRIFFKGSQDPQTAPFYKCVKYPCHPS